MPGSRRLLVMDDESEIRSLIAQIAQADGYTVEQAVTVSEFKNLIASFDPSVIVIDLVMPDIDGLTLVHYLADQNSRARVIVISGYGKDYVRHASRIGSDYGLPDVVGLNKPFSLSALRAALN